MFEKRFYLLAILAFLLGCVNTRWPPQIDALKKKFSDNHSEIAQLLEMFKSDGHKRVKRSLLGTKVKARSNLKDTYEFLPKKRASQYTSLLDKTHIFSISKVGQCFYFPVGTDVIDGTKYSAYFVYTEDQQSVKNNCVESKKNDICGKCFLKVRDNWFISYEWYPEGIEEFDKDCQKEGREKYMNSCSDMPIRN